MRCSGLQMLPGLPAGERKPWLWKVIRSTGNSVSDPQLQGTELESYNPRVG